MTSLDSRGTENHFNLMILRSRTPKVWREGFSLFSSLVKVICSVLCVVLSRQDKSSIKRTLMGGDLVPTEPPILRVYEEVKEILERARLYLFL
eukprot:Gb_10567 [translate_table: standard]